MHYISTAKHLQRTAPWLAELEGGSIQHGKQELAVFRLSHAVQPNGTLTVADPIYKTTYNLQTGEGISNPNLNLSTFNIKLENGKVFVQVPPCSEMEEAFDKTIQESFKADGKECKKSGGPVPVPKDLSW